jgi:hypothetical protein
MAVWNLGSAAAQINGLVENIPTSISGAVLLQLIDMQRVYIEQYTGLTVGSTAIEERFQLPLVNLSIAELLHAMQTQGVDGNSISLGDFSQSKGQGGNLSDASNTFRERGIEQLKNLGFRFSNYQAL